PTSASVRRSSGTCSGDLRAAAPAAARGTRPGDRQLKRSPRRGAGGARGAQAEAEAEADQGERHGAGSSPAPGTRAGVAQPVEAAARSTSDSRSRLSIRRRSPDRADADGNPRDASSNLARRARTAMA